MDTRGKKIKVLIAINDFLVGGAQRLITEQCKYFDRDKFEIAIVTLFEFNGRKTLYQEIPDYVPCTKLSFEGVRDVRGWFVLARVIREFSPDVVVSHLFFSNFVLRIMSLVFSYKVIIVEQNTYSDKTRIQILIDRILSRLTYRIVAVSETVKRFTMQQEKIPEEKFVVIHNSIDVDRVRRYASSVDKKKMKDVLGLDQKIRYIVNAARLTDQKNHRLLIESFAEFSKTHGQYKLLLLGEGRLYVELQGLIDQLGVGGKVLLLGVKENPLDYYVASDFFVSTSKIEGLSMAYLEALACGLPLLSTVTAGTDEILIHGENGYRIAQANKQAVIEGFRFMDGNDLGYLSANAGRMVEKFDIKRNVRAYENLIENSLR